MTRTDRLTLDFPFDGKAVDARDPETLILTGRASSFSELVDLQGDLMDPGAFSESLSSFMRAGGPVLYAHRPSMPMGRCSAAEVKADGLHVQIELPKPDPFEGEAARIWSLTKRGAIRALSIGGRGQRAVRNGITRVIGWRLLEVSICPVGVDPGAILSPYIQIQSGKAFGDPVPTDLAAVESAMALLEARTALLEARNLLARA